ncbi:MAG: metal-dependent transcriptional regulator [Candidatus Latescibacterota bacterium]
MAGITQAAEDYLQVIYRLQKGDEAVGRVTTSLIADYMQVSPASVTNMVKRLAEMDLVARTPYRGVELTEAGEAAALQSLRQHRLLELYLAETLGYDWDRIHAEADRLEHAISEEFEERIDRILGRPSTGAHGESIPTKEGAISEPAYVRLSDLEPGRWAVIRRVSDRSAEMLRYLREMHLGLGTRLTVSTREPFDGPLHLLANGGRRFALGPEVARRIFVELEPAQG